MTNFVKLGRRALVVCVVLVAVSAAWAKSAYFVQADVVRGAIGATGAVCVFNGVFQQGEQIVWRAYVFDSETGEVLTPEQVEALGVQVFGVIDGDQKAELHFMPHPPGSDDAEFFWAGGWQIPADYATGNYAWTLQVVDTAGNTAVYTPMGAALGLGALSIVESAN